MFCVITLGCFGLDSDLCFVSLPWGVLDWTVICVLCHYPGVFWIGQWSVFCVITLGCFGLDSDLCFVSLPWGVLDWTVIRVLCHYLGVFWIGQ